MVVVPKDEKRLQNPIKNRSCTGKLYAIITIFISDLVRFGTLTAKST